MSSARISKARSARMQLKSHYDCSGSKVFQRVSCKSQWRKACLRDLRRTTISEICFLVISKCNIAVGSLDQILSEPESRLRAYVVVQRGLRDLSEICEHACLAYNFERCCATCLQDRLRLTFGDDLYGIGAYWCDISTIRLNIKLIFFGVEFYPRGGIWWKIHYLSARVISYYAWERHTRGGQIGLKFLHIGFRVYCWMRKVL